LQAQTALTIVVGREGEEGRTDAMAGAPASSASCCSAAGQDDPS